ncbi:uncharacterized protein METZ01_LOCUS474528, partial [marine metagenome]
IGDQVTDEDTDFTIDLSASDVDIDENGQTLTYSALSSDESLVTVTTTTSDNGTTGTLTFDVLDEQNGEADITVTVNDAQGRAVDSETFTLTVNAINDTPILTVIGDQVTDEDTDFTIDLSASDVDIDENGQTLTYSAVSSDESLVTVSTTTEGNGTTGTLTFDVQSDQNGSADVTVTVTDSENGTAVETFTLTVNAVNDEPILTFIGNQSTDEDSDTTIVLSASDVDIDENGQTLTYSAVSSDES